MQRMISDFVCVDDDDDGDVAADVPHSSTILHDEYNNFDKCSAFELLTKFSVVNFLYDYTFSMGSYHIFGRKFNPISLQPIVC